MKNRLLILFLALFLTIPMNIADTSIIAPAVASSENGFVGTTVDITIKASNGEGHVFMDTNPLTEMDIQSSAQIASKKAFEITEKNQNNYNIYYIVHSDAPIIGGPSAGASLCVATIAELNGWKLNRSVMMTGSINPDGSIGKVGGILEKINASHSKNISCFLIPSGERFVELPYNNNTNDTNDTVDVIEYGKKLGITVIEVKSIDEALYHFTNYKINKTVYKENPLIKIKYNNIMKKLSDNALNLSENKYKELEYKLYLQNNNLNNSELQDLKNKLNSSKINIDKSKDLYLNKSYYSATSKAFGALIILENIETILTYHNSPNKTKKEEYTKNYLSEVQNNIDYDIKLVNNKAITKNNIEIIIASKSRLYESNKTMEKAWIEYNKGNLLKSLNYASYAKLRANSGMWWLSLEKDITTGETIYNTPTNNILNQNKVLNENDFKGLAIRYMGDSNNLVVHASTELPPEMLIDAQSNLIEAKNYYDKGEYLLSISKSIVAMVSSTTYFNYMGDVDYLRNISYNKINQVGARGVIPISALSYYEYSSSMDDKMSEVYYLKYSIYYAQLTNDIINTVDNNQILINHNSKQNNGNNNSNNNTIITIISNSKFKNPIIFMVALIMGLICGIFIGYYANK
ncbi:conserved hypothetical protein [Methanococcus aeolicus Nankai-3]|uniref:Lon proteolytic domain-containing protein n=1 Tax=Methanococcus aeolicus (strain ATCC BAA-1280 / DSM 17508 / OCM 812 / Nankai-3) TaxID=419665 RepID=A6UWS8_META3|nr:S16 family serine protease [Methanococcus aeolicus]ABR56950.1 conserved hypothetical protein [Methanococcus aeolicus Nankai-3]